MKISVIIPTLNAAARLPDCLAALVTPTLQGLVQEVIVVDGGSDDESVNIANGFGAAIINAPPGRGGQLQAGATRARGGWLLFLHGDTVLEEGWGEEVLKFIKTGAGELGVFTLAFDAQGIMPGLVASGAMARTKLFKLPYGDQGLLISKSLYEEIGGFKGMALMEDVEFISRVMREKGRTALTVFTAKAETSAERYERDGYLRRASKNLRTLLRYRLGASPEEIERDYS